MTDENAATAPARDHDQTAELGWLGNDRGAARDIAAIWATVDLERTLGDLGLDPALAINAVDDPLIGARIVSVDAAKEVANESIALAEPNTEGRLAGFLARHGEGPAGRYVALPLGVAAITARAAAAGIAVSSPANGPFGRAVLVVGGPASGSNLILVERPAVPSRP
ncbi:MAG: hypothetical protein H0U52_11755 [Chloroflexi bacterium]|nr:hypothetical protein [Chloroflexota bacterium]